jgi:hypothetical protein
MQPNYGTFEAEIAAVYGLHSATRPIAGINCEMACCGAAAFDLTLMRSAENYEAGENRSGGQD